MHVLRPQERLWYRRDFTLPEGWSGQRVLLHFEASDWETSVYVNGRRLGQHRGGYDRFSFDITDALKSGPNTLHVCAWDGTEQHCQPVGKQIMPENRQGFRYQPTGGIWQTVWLEAVPETRIASWNVKPRLDGFDFTAQLSRPALTTLRVTVDGQKPVQFACGGSTNVTGSVPISNARLWSPDSPHLYDVQLALVSTDRVVDSITSYVGLRTFARRDDGRLVLNGQPAPLMFGPLDQGYWPDGILTPPHEDAITFDLEYLKAIGCNMVRVHIKTHPARWYYHADRLGLLVWQDMICTPKYGQTVDKAGSENWQREFAEIIRDFGNHPAIVSWIVFNEAWGQHDTKANTARAAQADPSRVINSASGWTDHGAGDVLDIHHYSFYPSAPTADGFGNTRALVFGEVGGHNLLLPGKKWHPDQKQRTGPPLERAGGRMNFNSTEDLALKYPFYIRNLRHFAQRAGYQAFVYTQISDIEHECNGWLTYDRKVSKLPTAEFQRIHDSLSKPLHYTELLGNGEWLAGPVTATPRNDDQPNAAWTGAGVPAAFMPFALPRAGAPLNREGTSALGLRRSLTLTQKPAHAVIEIRAQHRNALKQPPPERLNGHATQPTASVDLVTYLDGRLHRRTACKVQTGQGEAVTFLELTDAELASLTPGEHTLAVEVANPEETTSLSVKLLGYAE
jgi:hypothetical protein